jgi:LuxR family maltose regulon positive regulatory protein
MACAVDAAGKQMSGQFPDGFRLLEESVSETEWTQPIQTKLMDYLCMVAFMQGDLATSQAWAERVEQIAGEHRLPDSLNLARHFLGVIHYLRHEFDAAEPYLRALLDDHALAAPSYLTMGAFALALIHNSRGDFIQADAIIDWVRTYFRTTRHAFALIMFQAFSVDLAWRRKDFDAAQRQSIGVNFALRPPLWFFYIPRLTPIKLLLAEGTPDALTAARATLEELAQQMAAIHRNVARIDILALLALVCDAQGDDVAAEASVTTALALAQKSGLIQPFVDLGTPMAKLLQRLGERDEKMSETTRAFVTQVLTASATLRTVHGGQTSSARFGAQRAPSWPLPFEPLTPRESEILQQLAGDATPAEIAVQSVVSLSTVRSQIKSIYRKLDVHNRIEAVNRGREFGIL